MLGSVLTAIATPFHENGKIDFDAFQRLAHYLVDHGSEGLVVVGTTGESPTLSDTERNDLIRAAIEAVGERATIVAATGTYSTRHSVCLTRDAHELGGDLQRSRQIDRELAPVYALLKITPNPIPIKAALNLIGHDVGNCRLPLVPPTDEELAQVRACLARLGLLVAA